MRFKAIQQVKGSHAPFGMPPHFLKTLHTHLAQRIKELCSHASEQNTRDVLQALADVIDAHLGPRTSEPPDIVATLVQTFGNPGTQPYIKDCLNAALNEMPACSSTEGWLVNQAEHILIAKACYPHERNGSLHLIGTIAGREGGEIFLHGLEETLHKAALAILADQIAETKKELMDTMRDGSSRPVNPKPSTAAGGFPSPGR